jgi:hypothetical protein
MVELTVAQRSQEQNPKLTAGDWRDCNVTPGVGGQG